MRLSTHQAASLAPELVSPVRLATASRTACIPVRGNPGRTAKTISLLRGKASLCKRKASRIILFILFRCTALPTFLGTDIPNRLPERQLSGCSFRKYTRVNPVPYNRAPFRYTQLNSLVFLRRVVFLWSNRCIPTRQIRLTDASVLWPDGVL